MFQDAGVGIALEDTTGAIFDANPAFEQISGASRADLRRTGMQDWIDHADRPLVGQALQQLGQDAENRRPAMLELRLKRGDGAEIFARTAISRVFDPNNGRLLYTAYFVQDVSSEQEARSNFQVAEQQNRALFQAIPDLILLLDSAGSVIDVIPAASGLLVTDPSQAVGRKLGEIVPALNEAAADLLAQTLEQGATVVREVSQPFADGSSKLLCARLARCGAENVVAVIQDNTAVVTPDDSARRLAFTFAHCQDAVVITNLAGKITDWNPAAEQMFGYRAGEILGHGLATLFSPDDRPAFNNRVADSLSETGEWSAQTPFFRADGSTGTASVRYVAIDEMGTGQPTAILGINRPDGGGVAQIPAATGTGASLAAAAPALGAELQTLADLVGIHLTYGGSTEMRHALRINQERIRAVAMIHQLLKPGDPASVEVGAYLQLVRRSLVESFSVSPDVIAVRLECAEIVLPANQALLVGLIMNEFVGETLRVACAKGKSGAIAAGLTVSESVADFWVVEDGLEFPDTLTSLDGEAISLEVIRKLSEQLGAEFAVVASPQPAARFRFTVGGA